MLRPGTSARRVSVSSTSAGLVGADAVDAEVLDPVHRRPQPDRLGDLGGAGLELVGQVGPGGLVLADRADHVAAADEGRHRLEQLAPTVEDADPSRAVGLVTGPGVEVGVDRAEIDGNLRDRLGAIDQHLRPRLVGAGDDRLHRVDRPEHVGDVDHSDELGPASQQRPQTRPCRAGRRRARVRRRARPPARGRAAARGRCWSGAPSRSGRRGRRGRRLCGPTSRRRG